MTTQNTAATLERWAALVNDFTIAQRAARISPGTIRNRAQHVRRFAVATALPADHVTYEDYRGWLDDLDVTRSRMLEIRTSLRAFYRWASAAGRVHHDPTAEPEYVTRKAPIPPLWAADLAAFQAYLRSIGRPRSTITTRLAFLARFARDNARIAPADVARDDITEWMGTKRWAAETRRATKSSLRTFYVWMLDTGRRPDDPTAKLPVIRRVHHLPRPALDLEYAIALERADERATVMLRLAGEIGLRCTEIAHVHSRDLLDTADGPVLRVHGKGSRDRDIPLTENLARMLRILPEGYAIPGRISGHISPAYVSKLLSRLLPLGVTAHMLRHRFASRVYNHSGDLLATQQLLGHASPETTRVYVQLDQANRRRIIDAVAS